MVNICKEYQQYYTSSKAIVQYMIRLLEGQSGMSYLEPSVGSGIFVDALDKIPNIKITGYDIDISSVFELQKKYSNKPYIHIEKRDTLTETNDNFFYKQELFDRIIGNPPYGAKQDYIKKVCLKNLYPNFYVKETYTLFLKQCIQLLNPDGILVFIVPDTFLNLHVHAKLRKFILDETNIREIALFPSRFFPGIQFGYSNLCIIKLQKKKFGFKNTSDTILVRNNFKNVEELNNPNYGTKEYIAQSSVYNNLDYALFTNSRSVNNLSVLINNATLRIGNVADCVTGFYSGNDSLYLKCSENNTRGTKKYSVVTHDLVCQSESIPLDGIDSSICYIPIMKGGGIKFYKPTLWYMNWSKQNVHLYRESSRARFQNSQYYFREGIGVPMVSSTHISAALLERRLFDQSIVGIFPKDERLLYYMLGFFNSSICNDFIRTINPSTNNSANYIKKIPFVIPSGRKLNYLSDMVRQIILCRKNNNEDIELESLLNDEICNLFGSSFS